MLKYVNTGIVFQEIPDEVTLAINISNCPCHCPGCHSHYLWEDIGLPLDTDAQNNDFGWAHLPKSFMNQNTVFLLITAMAANFYRYIVALPLMAVLFGIKATDRVKSFLFRFIAVPAKWIRTARQYKLNIYSNKPYNIIWDGWHNWRSVRALYL